MTRRLGKLGFFFFFAMLWESRKSVTLCETEFIGHLMGEKHPRVLRVARDDGALLLWSRLVIQAEGVCVSVR